MTNRELIQECTGQCCPGCAFEEECNEFKKKNNNLLPEEVGTKFIGKTLETPDGRLFKFDKDFLEKEVGK